MKIAIHHRENSFSARWIEYCKLNNIPYILVDAFDNDIIQKIKEQNVTHFMWHINHSSQKELMVYPYLLNGLDEMGVKTFPNFNTRWHFEDKIAQKYLFESIGDYMVPSYVFYDEKKALEHIEIIQFPIVSKLKRGAGATNVKLLNNIEEAKAYIHQMFTKGVNPHKGALGNIDAKMRMAKKIKNPIILLKKVLGHLKRARQEQAATVYEKGYFYYQEFLPNNAYDTRVVVVGNKAIALRRYNRENDFRASGAGKFSYETSLTDINAIKIAHEVAKKLGTQSLAFDIVYDQEKKVKIIEVCLGFIVAGCDPAPGYWDADLNFHEGTLNLQFEMMRNFIK